MIYTIKLCNKTIHNVRSQQIFCLCPNNILYQRYNISFVDDLSITRYNKFHQIQDLSFRGKFLLPWPPSKLIGFIFQSSTYIPIPSYVRLIFAIGKIIVVTVFSSDCVYVSEIFLLLYSTYVMDNFCHCFMSCHFPVPNI